MHVTAAVIVAQHIEDLRREAEAERRIALVRGARRSERSPFFGRLTGLLGRLTGSGRRTSSPASPSGAQPATA